MSFIDIHVPGKIHVGPDTLSRKDTTVSLVNIAGHQEGAWDEAELESHIERGGGHSPNTNHLAADQRGGLQRQSDEIAGRSDQ